MRRATTGTIHNNPNQETASEHGKPQRLASEARLRQHVQKTVALDDVLHSNTHLYPNV
jgi:hypothetical protein